MTVLPQYLRKYGYIHPDSNKSTYKELKRAGYFMKYLRLQVMGWLVCIVFASYIMPVGYLTAGTVHTFKRVKVARNPSGPRINIQIKPEESYYHQKPSISTSLPVGAPKTVVKSVDQQYGWFWSGFSHDLAGASLLRLKDAEQQLAKSPAKSKGLAPSLANMRQLAATYGTDILLASINRDVSPALVLAVIGVESAGKADEVSSAGAVGLMQLIPETAKRFNVVDSTDPKQNIAGGVAYLDWLIKKFNHDPVLALAGYNAGENAVNQYQGVPPFPETRGYIPKVVAAWQVAKALCKTAPQYATDGCVFDFQPKISQQ